MIFVFWWYVNHLWCNLNTLGPLTKIWIFLPFRPVRLPWQPDLCAEMLVLGHIWGAKSEKLKKVLENFFLIMKHEMNIKLFTEGFLEILKKKFFFKFPLAVLPRAGKKCYFWPINGSHSKNILNFKKPLCKKFDSIKIYMHRKNQNDPSSQSWDFCL